MKIFIITDGNNKLGLGHVYQSLSLAAALIKKAGKDLELTFVTKSEEKICKFIESFGHKVQFLKNDDLIFSYLEKEMPDRIIFDKLDVNPSLAKDIKEILHIKLIIFTNLTEANNYADLMVLADIGSNFKNIIKRDESIGKLECIGPKFWILRPEFYELKAIKKKHNERVKNIMLIFGGSDPSNMSSSVLNELLKIDNEFNILLVLGNSFEHQAELNAVMESNKKSKSKVNIVRNMTNVGESMHSSDVVFASPGLSFFESLAVGTPVIGFHQNELQKEVYAEVLPTLGLADISKLPSIIENKQFLYPTDKLIIDMEIGEGKDALVDEILN